MSTVRADVQLRRIAQVVRRWPVVAILVSVVLLASSPWLHSRLKPRVYYNEVSDDKPQLSPRQLMYNPLGVNFKYEKAVEIAKCLSNERKISSLQNAMKNPESSTSKECPAFFNLIEKDLAPWRRKGITRANVEMANGRAAFRVIILDGQLYVDRYSECYGSRALFTIWGLLLFLEKYKGQVSDVELMFNCADRPHIPIEANGADGPPVLFSYNTNSGHFDIPFPDWSFWGWSELMIGSWDEERTKIMNGSQKTDWKLKVPKAFWAGNPNVAVHRKELAKCHNASKTDIRAQDWAKELPHGKQNSKLEDQCTHRYMIYTEGVAWSVSLKYILACGSPTLLISPTFYDFFSRGLQEWADYIPVRPSKLQAPELCQSLDEEVAYGETNNGHARRIGKSAQAFMQNEVGMENVYNYVFHLLQEYAKLQRFKPSIPGDPHPITLDHMRCLTRPFDRQFLQRAMEEMPGNSVPCQMSTVEEYTGFDWEVKSQQRG